MPRLTSGDDDDGGEGNGVDDDVGDGNYFWWVVKKERLGEPSFFQPYFKKKYN